MSEVDSAIRYIFVLSLILIIVAYYVGSQNVLSTLGTATTGLLYTATGRTSQGTFTPYPATK